MNKSTVKCRVCWEDKETNICVLVTTKWAKDSLKTIKDVILLCVPWMTIKNDSHLCKPCLWQLKFTYDFIERCLKTENVLNEQCNENNVKISLEDLFERSLKSGNKIQIIFENPVSPPTGDTEDTDAGSICELVEDCDECDGDINFKIHNSGTYVPSEHDYCITKGTQMNVDITNNQQNNMEPIPKTQDELNKKPKQNISEALDPISNKDDKGAFILIDDDLSNDENDSSIEPTDAENEPYSSENKILKNILSNNKRPRSSKTTLKKYDTPQDSTPPQDPLENELRELLDIAPINIWYMTAYSDMSQEEQDDLVREGVNILNMSKNPNTKKRTIFLSRDLFQGYYQCNKCKIAFVSRCDSLDHEHLHRRGKIKTAGEPVYTCKMCSATFALDIDFRTHTKVHHGISSPHVCPKCNRRFKTLKLLNDHSEKFKDQEKCVYKCTKCNKEFFNYYSLTQHEKDVEDAPCCNYRKCSVCFEKFTKEDFKVHSDQVHPNHLCPECGKMFGESVNLAAHRKYVHYTKHSPQHCMCHECGKILSHPRNLEHHIQTVHGEKIYMCDKCPRQFACVTYLRKHSQIHLGTLLAARRKFRCDKCGKAYTKKETLRLHEMMFHLQIKKYTCSICDEGFLRKDYFKRHLKHHEKYSFNTCTVCKKSFGTQWRLENHIFVGHDENGKSLESGDKKSPLGIKRNPTTNKRVPYKCVCKICNKVLANQVNLKSHYRAHLRLRQRHKCDMCGIILQTRMALTNHLKRHSDPNFKFSCNICHAYKSSSIELEHHMLEVHKDKKYKCTLCPAEFGRKHLLLSHEALVHQEETYKKEAILHALEKDQIFLPPDPEGTVKSRKGTKIGKLEVDINTVFNNLVNKGEEFDGVPGSSNENPTLGLFYKRVAENQSHTSQGKNVVTVGNEYGSIEDERACRILEEENRNNELYISYRD